MNKSKFLKKSLAMLLALMLVVAMIPLSAAAADADPVISHVYVNGVDADISGTSVSAEIPVPVAGADVAVRVVLKDNVGSIAHYIDQVNTSNAQFTNNLWEFELTDEEQAAGSAKFVLLDGGKQVVATYDLTFTTKAKDDNVAVDEIHVYEADNDANRYTEYAVSQSYNAEENRTDFTLVAPYGYTLGADDVRVKLASATSEVAGATYNDDDGTYSITVNNYNDAVSFTVNAQDGSEMQYTVTVVEPAPFASFALENERHTSQIERVTEDPDFQTQWKGAGNRPQVEVYLPYGENASDDHYYFTPEFTTNYVVKVEAAKGYASSNFVEFKSGETYDLNDFAYADSSSGFDSVSGDNAIQDSIMQLRVTYSDESTETWYLAFDVPANDPVPAITGLSVENVEAAIEGDTITLTLPAAYRKDNATVNLTTTSKIDVVGQTPTGSPAPTNTLTLDLRADGYTLRAEAAGAEFDANGVKAIRDYELVIKTATAEAPKMTNMTLKSADGKTEIKASIDDSKKTITFSGIPYKYKSVGDMNADGWKLFWTATSGAAVTYGDPATKLPTSGTVIAASASTDTYLPESANRFDAYKDAASKEAATGNATIDLNNGGQTISYSVIFDSADASQVSTLGTVQLAKADVTTYDELNSTNTIDLKVNNSGNTKTITGEVYANDWDGFTNYNANYESNGNGAAVVTTLPDGAELYYVSSTNYLMALDALNEDNTDVDNYIRRVDDYTDDYAIPNTATSELDYTPLQIVVVSEALAEKVGAYNSGSDIMALSDLTVNANEGLYTIYEFTLREQENRTGVNVTDFTVYDHYTGASATSKITGNEIAITVPYYFTDANHKSIDNLYLDYETQDGGATVTAYENLNEADLPASLVYKLDGTTVDTGASVDVAWNDSTDELQLDTTLDGKGTKFDVVNLQVTAENGTDREAPYIVNVEVAEPNTAAVLNSVTINKVTATPDANGNVTITLPYGTEVTSLNPTFNVSTNAYVVDGTKDRIAAGGTYMVDSDDTFNFYNSRQFTVVSEDGKATKTYTVTVKVSDQFTDVNPGDWFYDNVMNAVANGYMSGLGDGTFGPMKTATRAQFASALACAMGYEAPEDPTTIDTPFVDVDADDWYAGAVAFCKENGIISGYEDTTFRPDQTITRQEAAAMLNNAFGLEASTDVSKFTDAGKIASWATAHVGAVANAELMNGDAAGTFRPTGTLTRAELASILMNANIHGFID